MEKTAGKKFCLGMLVIVLVFGFMTIGCDFFDDNSTVEFKIENNLYFGYIYIGMGPITKIEIFNGRNTGNILQTYYVNIPTGETSEIFKVSGFNNKPQGVEDRVVVGVELTFENNETLFGTYLKKKNIDEKILVKIGVSSRGNLLHFESR